MPLPPIIELVTHDGRFHADEVLATAVLADLFPVAAVFRSRDPKMIAPSPGRIVYDVGSLFDPQLRIFDHHQPGAPMRGDDVPYSAFGLIWREFGRHWLARFVAAEHLEEVFTRLDQGLVRTVDAVDNGQLSPGKAGEFERLTIFSLIADFAPSWRNDDEIEMNAAFDHAWSFASSFLQNRANSVLAEIEAEAIVRRRIEETDGPILSLPQGMPWHGAIFESGAKHVLMVVHPRSDGNWVVSTVPVIPGNYETRLDLPEAWAGLEHKALQEASGIESAVFCHAARFMAVVGNEEDAMRMAETAIRVAGLEEAPDPVP